MSAEPLLGWESGEIDGCPRLRGFIAGQPGHTLYIIKPAGPDGQDVKLLGALIPDEQERTEVYDLESAKRAAEEILRTWVGMAAELIEPSNKALADVRTPAAVALKELFQDADGAVALDVASGTLHKGTALATLYYFREAVRPFNAALADEMIAVETEKAEVRT